MRGCYAGVYVDIWMVVCVCVCAFVELDVHVCGDWHMYSLWAGL